MYIYTHTFVIYIYETCCAGHFPGRSPEHVFPVIASSYIYIYIYIYICLYLYKLYVYILSSNTCSRSSPRAWFYFPPGRCIYAHVYIYIYIYMCLHMYRYTYRERERFVISSIRLISHDFPQMSSIFFDFHKLPQCFPTCWGRSPEKIVKGY